MAWSTRELADLAGTTVGTVRHYHRLGLLPEPDRRENGYKQYGVAELLRLLRIRRLAELGVPLGRIDDVWAGGESAGETLREVDAELAAGVERLQRARADIAAILDDAAPGDVPPGFELVAARLSDADRSILHVITRLYDDEAVADLRTMVEEDYTDGSVTAEFNALAADADETTRQCLTRRLTTVLAANLSRYPWLLDPTAHLSRGGQVARNAFVEAVVEVYNAAQLDVLERAGLLAVRQLSGREVPART